MFNADSLNQHVVNAEYAVRGAIVQRANELKTKLAQDAEAVAEGREVSDPLPFSKMIFCNIGNPHALELRPLTYIRQALSLYTNPSLLDHPAELKAAGYSQSAIKRAQEVIKVCPTTVFAYTDAAGFGYARDKITSFIGRRDGLKPSSRFYPDPSMIYLSDGATPAIFRVLEMLTSGPKTGILVPVPGYSLYTAVLAILNTTCVPYYLSEENGWSLDATEIERAIERADAAGVSIKGLVVINPNNPCGSITEPAGVADTLRIAAREGFPVIADEVYQDNLNYLGMGQTWHSFRHVLVDLIESGAPGLADVPLFSTHSISKGYHGLCGLRGGYVECLNVPDDVRAVMRKLWAASSLSANATGQMALAAALSPPTEADDDYETFVAERDNILASLARRANRAHEALNKLDGMSCVGPNGALYAFPRVELPEAAVKAAREEGITPDFMYCRDLLEARGIVVVPGSGFLQREGTYHFRTTLLPPEKDFADYLAELTSFHNEWMAKWRN